jgi:hypothetical protein
MATLRLALGSLLLVLCTILLQPSLAQLSGRRLVVAMSLLLGALFLVAGLRGLLGMERVRIVIAPRGLILAGPRAAELELPGEADTGRRTEHLELRWQDLRTILLDREGLGIASEGRSVRIPFDYRKQQSRRAGLGFEMTFPCFDKAELEWLGGLLQVAGQKPDTLEELASRIPSRPAPGPWLLRLLCLVAGTAPAVYVLLRGIPG